MSVNTKTNNVSKILVEQEDTRKCSKLSDSHYNFATLNLELWDNIYNYSKIVVIGKAGTENEYNYFHLCFNILPDISKFNATQALLMNSTDMRHVLMTIKNCTTKSNTVTIVGQIRKDDSSTVEAVSFDLIYGIK